MKKAGILAMLLAGALVLGMGVGCGGNGNQGGTQQGGTQQGGTQQGGTQQGGTEHTHAFAEGWTSDGEYHWHEATCGHAEAVKKEAHVFTDNECTVCGYYKIDKDTDVSAIVSDKLTEEEWKEALSEETLDNFMLYGNDIRLNIDNVKPTTGKIGAAFSGKSFDIRASLKEEGNSVGLLEGMIAMYNGGQVDCYQYLQFDEAQSQEPTEEEWAHLTASEEDFAKGEAEGMVVRGLAVLRRLKDNYAQAKYDDAIGAYVCTEKDETNVSGEIKFFVKFKGGRLCALTEDCYANQDFMIVYGYGEAEIAPPTDYVEMGDIS